MKIAFFTDTYEPQINGVVKSINSFKKELEKMGHEVHIFCPTDKGAEEKERVYRLRSFKFKPYPEYRVGLPSARVLKKIKKIGPDIIHLHGPFSMGLAGLTVAKYKKIPIISTYHTSISDYTHYLSKRKIAEKYNKKITKKYIKWFYNKSDLIISPSSCIKEMLKEYGVNTKTKIIPTGIEIENFGKEKKFEKTTILHVGRVTKEKRIGSVVDAFKKVNKKIDSVLIITSNGPYRNELEKTISRKNVKNVKLTGYLSDEEITELYKRSHVFVCASRSETQGLVVLESMAYGCPVVVSNYMGFRDFVKNCENGLLFDEDEEMVEKIIKIIKDKSLRKKIIENGYKTAKKYTIEKCSKKLENVYKNMIDD